MPKSSESLEISGPGSGGRKEEDNVAGNRMEEGQPQSRGNIVGLLNQVSVRVSEVNGHNGSFCPSSGDWTLLNGDITNLKWEEKTKVIHHSPCMRPNLIPYSGLEDPCIFLTLSPIIFPSFPLLQPYTSFMALGRVPNCFVPQFHHL